MTDQNSQFFAILTAVGEAKQANANALGVPWTFAQMGVGDANNTDPVPSRTQTKLINERRRAPLNQLTVDPKNASIIIAEQVIPPDEGGWWIREIGLYDAAGDLVAVANCAPSFKPLLSQGTGKTQVVRLNLIVTSTANVQLKIDPSVVLATRDYIETVIMTVLPPTRPAGTYTKVQVNNRGVLIAGDNPTTLAGYGITDAMPKFAGGLLTRPDAVQGKLREVADTRFVTLTDATTDRPAGLTYGVGMHVAWGAGEQGIDFIGSLEGEENFYVRHYTKWGTETYRRLWTEKNFNPDSKADKAKTLVGYGITDALSNRGGEVNGNLTFLSAHNLYMRAGQTQSFASGLTALSDTDVTQAGIGFWGSQAAGFIKAYLGLGPTPWANGLGIRVDNDGVEITGATRFNGVISGNGSGLHSLPMATQVEAEAGTDATKPMSSLRVFQAVAKIVRQATESAAGVFKVATLEQVNAGLSDDVAVTPSKMRWGFRMLVGGNGYVVLPKWLGGLILQWGATSAQLVNTIGTTTAYFAYPIQFPSGALFVTTSNVGTSEPRSSGVASNVYDASGFFASFENTRSDQSVAARWFAIGS
ncbi:MULTISPECIES: phage tail protein [unclassified Pseudomonas]|uniref:phage tail protein n=1 Tax=unclassified Pseudomonas TaxID=196821 RepID=UPI0021C5BE61|nr:MULTISPECIES: phage tail protein [unclassified Pseudomonas]MCU1730607.1 phage tail protein [Pseudomonas sp. 20P_3.2_Bac4]MCU1745460.1 phage tail protein [Pseudomonas sp. 20P_3.2_Bac5]